MNRLAAPCNRRRRFESGFTLTELAIVMMVVALLLGGLVMTLSAQMESRDIADTRRTLEAARDALIGFAVQNGRLPCPGQPGSNGLESGWDSATGACAQAEGLLPAATLGLGPVDAQGFVRDSWLGDPVNRIRYRVATGPSYTNGTCPGPLATVCGSCSATAIANVFTAAAGMRQAGFNCLNASLTVCTTAGVSAVTDCSASAVKHATMAVVWSVGKSHAALGAVSADEQENTDGDAFFVDRELSPAGATASQFDDLVIWIPPQILYNRLIAGGAI
jgi:prepilin-type N-terminal cleavage/methylation domain-containing protein